MLYFYKLFMKHHLFLVNSILVLILFSCNKDDQGSCFKMTGEVISEKRILTVFDSIRLERRIELYLVPDTINYAEVEAGRNLLPKIRTDLQGNTLVIRNDNRCNWVRSYEIPVRVYLHHTGIRHIVNFGTGKIISTDTLRSPEITLEFRDASSDVNLRVNNQRVHIIQHTGASDVKIFGKTGELSVYMSSLAWGDYRALAAAKVYVESRSAADCFVRATESYFFRLRAAGNIYYSASAPLLGKEVTGSGNLVIFD
jgi:hypothetical protein